MWPLTAKIRIGYYMLRGHDGQNNPKLNQGQESMT
jgi:hypothetical protein